MFQELSIFSIIKEQKCIHEHFTQLQSRQQKTIEKKNRKKETKKKYTKLIYNSGYSQQGVPNNTHI